MTLHRVTLVFAAVLLCAAARAQDVGGLGGSDAPQVVAEICYGGVIEIPRAGLAIRPNERLGTADRFRDGGATLSAGSAGEGEFEATWTFAPKAEVSVHHLSFELDPATYAGGVALACDRRVELPKAFAGTVHLIVGEGRDFLFNDATGRERLRVAFSEPVRLHAMDSRAWSQDNIVFRFERPAVTNAPVVFVCRVAVSGVQVGVVPRPDYVVTANSRWIPAVITRDVVAGSALDFSSLVPVAAPITERDRIIVRDGRFEVVGHPGKPVRFYGCNVTSGANFIDAKTAETLVSKLRRLGYNSLRLHHHDNGLSQDVSAADPLVAACSRQGLYLTTDLFVSRQVAWRDVGEDREGFVGMDEFKRLVLTHEGAYSNYCAFARKWLTHVNPLTGRRLADEPALALLAFVNEGHLGTEGEAAKADAALEMRFAARVADFLRNEVGTKALLSDMSAGMENEAFRPVRESAAYDYVDEHYYCDHPTFPETAWRLPARLMGENPLRTWSGVGLQRRLANVRVKGKPFVMTEWDWTGCFAYRSAAGLVVASVAAADGWDGLWRFNFADSPWEAMRPDECGIGLFSISGNPLVQATERAAFCLFVRGDATSDDQFVHDKARGAFTVDTPRTAGGFVESGDIRTKTLVARCQGGPTTVWASALDDRPLAESGRILLTHLTDIQNAGQTYADGSRRILKKWGRVPHLFRTGTAQVALVLGKGDFEVWALGSDGTRLRKVPSAFTSDGRLSFVTDVAADPSSATWLYEILKDKERTR